MLKDKRVLILQKETGLKYWGWGWKDIEGDKIQEFFVERERCGGGETEGN